jgi:hypothetical protein
MELAASPFSEGGFSQMRLRYSAVCASALLILGLHVGVLALSSDDADTDSRMVRAKVVEVNEHRISVIAQTGVEHVIATNDTATKVLLNGTEVRLKDLRKGDVVTVQLDESSQLKFAKEITIAVRADYELARTAP